MPTEERFSFYSNPPKGDDPVVQRSDTKTKISGRLPNAPHTASIR